MKDNKKENFTLYAGCFGLGIATVMLGSSDINWLGYTLGAVGGVAATFDTFGSKHPYKKLFENLKLSVGDVIPKYLGKKKTEYGYQVTLSLPPGLSTKDFEKNKLEIEQYLNKKIDIEYANHRIYMKVYEKELEKLIPYEFVKCKGILEFNIGAVFGEKSITLDLEKVVHLLIAGETGSGKSTLIRSILTSIILSNKKVSLHLIDLKNGAEFNLFRKCKMGKAFSRTIEEADVVLSTMLIEVDRRYDLFYENEVVDIREYNSTKGLRKLNYEIVVIDEFADLQDEKGFYHFGFSK